MSSSAFPASPVLVFDRTDPTAAGGLQGAVLTLAALGCQPLSVVTSLGCGDTRGLEQVYAVDPEALVEQARPVLEDVPVRAILVGDPGSLDNLGVIAEIVADYDAPLVFAPGDLRDAPDPDEADDLAAASIELLLPQTTVLVLDETSAHRLVSSGGDEAAPLSARDAVRVLLECGAASVLLADGRDASKRAVDTLYGAGGEVRALSRDAPAGPVAGTTSALGASLCAGLAMRLPAETALQRAHQYLVHSLAAAHAPGMGAAQADRLAPLRGAER